MKTPLFSIIIPIHLTGETDPRAGMINQLIETVPTRDDTEVIIVDDHSKSRLDIPTLPNITTIMNQPDRRFAGTARNTGLEQAKGQWIIFADSDDLFYKSTLNTLMDEIALGNYQNTDMIISPVHSFRENMTEGTRHTDWNASLHAWEQAKPTAKKILLSRIIGPCGRIISKSFLDRENITFQQGKYGNDVSFSAVVGATAETVNLYNSPFYTIREGHASLVSTITKEAITSRMKNRREANRQLKNRGLKDCRLRYMARLWRYKSLGPGLYFSELFKCGIQDPGLVLPSKSTLKNRTLQLIQGKQS